MSCMWVPWLLRWWLQKLVSYVHWAQSTARLRRPVQAKFVLWYLALPVLVCAIMDVDWMAVPCMLQVVTPSTINGLENWTPSRSFRGCAILEGLFNLRGAVQSWRGCTFLEDLYNLRGAVQSSRGCAILKGLYNLGAAGQS